MNIWDFMSENPIQTFILVIFVFTAFGSVLFTMRFCWNRLLRHLNVRKAGWPPVHLDADGDWKPEPKNE